MFKVTIFICVSGSGPGSTSFWTTCVEIRMSNQSESNIIRPRKKQLQKKYNYAIERYGTSTFRLRLEYD